MAFARYLVVGLAATAVHYLVLYVLVEKFGCAPPLAAAAGAVCGAFAAYAGNWHFTFARSAGHAHALPRFLAVAAWGALASAGIVWMGTRLMGLHYLLAQAMATMLVVLMSFRINRAWTFK